MIFNKMHILPFFLSFICIASHGMGFIEYANKSKINSYLHEYLYLHTDRDIYVAGEDIFFKVYLLNSNTNSEIQNSKIAYFVIRDKNQKRIIESRIWLENNNGFGQIYIPDTLSTGTYQISVFTNWMKDEFEQFRFNKEVFIVNRFDTDYEVNEVDVSQSNLNFEMSTGKMATNLNRDSSYLLKLNASSEKYSARSKVAINALFSSLSIDDSIADVSISVSEINLLDRNEKNSIFGKYLFQSDSFKNDLNYKDIETKGIIVSGKIRSDDNEINGQTIYLSTPDTIANLQYVITDSSGSFHFMLSSYYEGKSLFIGLMKNKKNANYNFIIDDKYSSFIPYKPSNNYAKIQSSYIKRLQDIATVNKSFEVKFSKELTSELSYFYCPQLYSNADHSVHTSDFLYLNQLDVIIQETLYGVKINKKDKNSVNIFDSHRNQIYTNSFVFLDGVPFFNISKVLEYGTDKVKRIEVINSTWVLDTLLFNGVLSIFTHNYEIFNFKNEKNQIVIPVGKYLPRTTFFYPNYSSGNIMQNKPDFRQLLYWNPQVKLVKDKPKVIEFFTSDLCSDFLVKVEGVTNMGKPVSSTIIIKVEND